MEKQSEANDINALSPPFGQHHYTRIVDHKNYMFAIGSTAGWTSGGHANQYRIVIICMSSIHASWISQKIYSCTPVAPRGQTIEDNLKQYRHILDNISTHIVDITNVIHVCTYINFWFLHLCCSWHPREREWLGAIQRNAFLPSFGQHQYTHRGDNKKTNFAKHNAAHGTTRDYPKQCVVAII